MQNILDALARLDTTNDEHWTADGQPKLDALGIPGVKRKEVVAAAPNFTRDNPSLGLLPEDDTEPEVDEDEPEDVDTFPASNVEPTEEVKSATQKALEDAQVAFNLARAELDRAIKAADEEIIEQEYKQEGRTSQHDIMDFLQRQHENRMIRAGMKSQLDNALGRKSNRGAQRPKRG